MATVCGCSGADFNSGRGRLSCGRVSKSVSHLTVPYARIWRAILQFSAIFTILLLLFTLCKVSRSLCEGFFVLFFFLVASNLLLASHSRKRLGFFVVLLCKRWSNLSTYGQCCVHDCCLRRSGMQRPQSSVYPNFVVQWLQRLLLFVFLASAFLPKGFEEYIPCELANEPAKCTWSTGCILSSATAGFASHLLVAAGSPVPAKDAPQTGRGGGRQGAYISAFPVGYGGLPAEDDPAAKGEGRRPDPLRAQHPKGGNGVPTGVIAMTITTEEEGFARESLWGRNLRQRWTDPSYMEMIARTIDGLGNEEFWLATLSKQLQLQSSKAHLKSQRLERHKLEHRRKKQALAAFNSAAAQEKLEKYQRKGGGGAGAAGTAGEDGKGALSSKKNGGIKARGGTMASSSFKNEAELRFGELSLYSLDWLGPRTCAQLPWAAGNDVCALSLEIEIHVLHTRLMLKSIEVQERQNKLFLSVSGAEFFRILAGAAVSSAREGSDPERRLHNRKKGISSGVNRRSQNSSPGSGSFLGVGENKDDKDDLENIPLSFWEEHGDDADDEWSQLKSTRMGWPAAAEDCTKGGSGCAADKRQGLVNVVEAPLMNKLSTMVAKQRTATDRRKDRSRLNRQPLRKLMEDRMPLGRPSLATATGFAGVANGAKKGRGHRRRKAESYNDNVYVSLGSSAEIFEWESLARELYIPALADLHGAGQSLIDNFISELQYLMSVLDREQALRSEPYSVGDREIRTGAVHGSKERGLNAVSGRIDEWDTRGYVPVLRASPVLSSHRNLAARTGAVAFAARLIPS